MFYTKSHVRALEAQIADLQAKLAEARQERLSLLDRLLAKNNLKPIQEVKKQAVVEMVTPWGAAVGEIEDGLRASFIAEEKAYLMAQGHTEERAEALAEQEYRSRHEVVR